MGHIVRGEDDDVAFGVPVAEHTSVIVRPEGRWRQKRLGWAHQLRPSTLPVTFLHLGAKAVPTQLSSLALNS